MSTADVKSRCRREMRLGPNHRAIHHKSFPFSILSASFLFCFLYRFSSGHVCSFSSGHVCTPGVYRNKIGTQKVYFLTNQHVCV